MTRRAHALYRRAAFEVSVVRPAQFLPDQGREVAFAGRSNAGKSSAINALTGIARLCHTSKQPGRTQAINFFRLDGQRRLVDLPGYGFAQVSRRMQEQWRVLIDAYLQQRDCLVGVVLVMDCRRPLLPPDRMLLGWLRAAGLPIHILLTKADKLSRSAAIATQRQVVAACRPAAEGVRAGQEVSITVQLFSARTGLGVDEARDQLSVWLGEP